MIKLKKLVKRYKMGDTHFTALKSLDLELHKGEFVALVGKSGSGKSTLLNILGGLDEYDEGDFLIDGKSTKEFKEKDWDNYRRLKVGFVFQQFNLIPHLTALENVEIAMSLSGLSKRERINHAIDLLNQVGLGDKINNKPNQLSGGEQQRVAIARALANNPDIILADEPTGALDEENTSIVMNVLKEIAETGKLVLLVTHDRDLSKYCNRLVELHYGEIITDNMISEPNNVTYEDKKIMKKQRLPIIASLMLSARNLMQKKWRTILTAFAASIGICGIALILQIGIGVGEKLVVETNKMFDRNLIIINKISPQTNNKDVINSDDIKRIKQIDGIKNIIPKTDYERPKLVFNGHEANVVSLSSTMPDEILSSNKDRKDIVYGRVPAYKAYEVAIPESVAKQLLGGDEENPQELLNEKIQIAFPNGDSNWNHMPHKFDENNPDEWDTGILHYFNYTVVGIIKDMKFVEVSGIISGGHEYEMFSQAQLETGLAHFKYQFDKEFSKKSNINETEYNEIFERARTEAINEIKKRIEKEFNYRTYAVIINNPDDMESIMNKLKDMGFEPKSALSIIEEVTRYINMIQIVLALLAGISLIVSSIMIGIVLYISVLERTKEIGIIKAIGARRRDIKRIFFAEASIIGILAGSIGVVMSLIIGIVINRVVMPIILATESFSLFAFSPVVSTSLIVFSTVLCIFASLIPSSKASKLTVIDALRKE